MVCFVMNSSAAAVVNATAHEKSLSSSANTNRGTTTITASCSNNFKDKHRSFADGVKQAMRMFASSEPRPPPSSPAHQSRIIQPASLVPFVSSVPRVEQLPDANKGCVTVDLFREGEASNINFHSRQSSGLCFKRSGERFVDKAASAPGSYLAQSTSLDSSLSAFSACATALGALSLVLILSAISSPSPFPTVRLQCALVAATCMATVFVQTRILNIRKLPLCQGYTVFSNSNVVSQRYTDLMVTGSLVAMTAFVARGPFVYKSYEIASVWLVGALLGPLTYMQYVAVVPVLCFVSVLLGVVCANLTVHFCSALVYGKSAGCMTIWLVVPALLTAILSLHGLVAICELADVPLALSGTDQGDATSLSYTKDLNLWFFVYVFIIPLKLFVVATNSFLDIMFDKHTQLSRQVTEYGSWAMVLLKHVAATVGRVLSLLCCVAQNQTMYSSVPLVDELCLHQLQCELPVPGPVGVWRHQIVDAVICIVDLVFVGTLSIVSLVIAFQ